MVFVGCLNNLPVTAWDTFTKDTPGQSLRYEVGGENCWCFIWINGLCVLALCDRFES